ncbi:SPOR domain-containing protein [Flavobacterium macacae]|uniref:SPOR domain-containing protein n=1 Tax=Flavobacterium macacae TaxID=2488993 RepID=A0A3P3WGR6_9FLAO|nr:SPOR domain-containing protein [Flavobacterium macacae]RRJ91773.1 SPOR domain-containing protein [Flavobacterium macacae]
MRILSPKSALLNVSFIALLSISAYSQEKNIKVTQDPKFEQLLAEKRKINGSLTVNERYKIQVYNGDSENAKKTLAEFRKEFRNLDGTIVFNTPTYKVWIGNFKTKIEAEKNLNDLRKKYPNAIVIKPTK